MPHTRWLGGLRLKGLRLDTCARGFASGDLRRGGPPRFFGDFFRWWPADFFGGARRIFSVVSGGFFRRCPADLLGPEPGGQG